MSKLTPVLVPLVLFGFVAAGLYGALLWAPTEKEMGDIQRIFYFHAPAGISCFIAFTITGILSAVYLFNRNPAVDLVAVASTEVGLLLCTIVLISGPIWARPVWGVWWTWEARLTTTLIMWLIFIGYILVRRYTTDSGQAARFASVIGIIGALNIPIVYRSIKWWRGMHPVVLESSGGGGLDPDMRKIFGFCIIVYLVLYAVLVWLRVSIGRTETALGLLRERASLRRSS